MRALFTCALVALAVAASEFLLPGAGGATAFGETPKAESPYRGQETHAIKALSPQQIDDYLNGRGLGYAKAAELNHYPGPRHVLDLAEELELTSLQATKSQLIFAAMNAEAVDLGKRLVEKESKLDQQFASETVDEPSLRRLLAEIGALEADLRFVHLSAHLKQRALLTVRQVHIYDQLRGYANAHGSGHDHMH
jgi:Spy/CpxP family protein refolding chaperone